MKTFFLMVAVAVAGCAKTSVLPLAPGEPESGEIVVSYYYLNF